MHMLMPMVAQENAGMLSVSRFAAEGERPSEARSVFMASLGLSRKCARRRPQRPTGCSGRPTSTAIWPSLFSNSRPQRSGYTERVGDTMH